MKCTFDISVTFPWLLNRRCISTQSLLRNYTISHLAPCTIRRWRHLVHTRHIRHQIRFGNLHEGPRTGADVRQLPERMGFANESCFAAGFPALFNASETETCSFVALVKEGEPRHGFNEFFGCFHFCYLRGWFLKSAQRQWWCVNFKRSHGNTSDFQVKRERTSAAEGGNVSSIASSGMLCNTSCSGWAP